jgi:hypothetical protein
MTKQDIKSKIAELLEDELRNRVEEPDEVEEHSETGNVAGYETPAAFSASTKTHKNLVKNLIDGSGYTLVESNMPNKIIDIGLRNIKKQLHEMNRVLDWYASVKMENDLDRNKYWKRTTKNIETIEQQMVEVFRKIKQL